MKIHVGTSGFSYGHWQAVFYPAALPPREWLEFYARHFNCVEINVTVEPPPLGGRLKPLVRIFSAFGGSAPGGKQFSRSRRGARQEKPNVLWHLPQIIFSAS